MLQNKTAAKFAADYHGGQWSALYQFAGSGIYSIENHLRYLQEIERCSHPEYDLHPGELTKKQESELTRLKDYFINMGIGEGLTTVWERHNLYSYMIPYLREDTPDDLANKVTQLRYAK